MDKRCSAARWWASLPFRVGLAVAGLALSYGLASAQTGAYSDCSGSVGATAAAITFPGSGATGNRAPTQFVFIVNPSATATLWVNAVGGTAVAAAAGSIPLLAQGNSVVLSAPAPSNISIIATAGSTPYTCWYK